MKRQWVPSAIAGDCLEVQECDAAGLAGAQCDDSFHSPRVVTEVHVSVGNQVVVDQPLARVDPASEQVRVIPDAGEEQQ